METIKNEQVKEALKKCNPQRAIIGLAEIVDQYDTQIQGAQNTANQALQDAAAAATVANEAKQEAAQATVNVGEAFDNARVSPNSSTVVVEFDRINGNAQNTALPVVNTTNAGILNANDYKFFKEYDARIRAVEGVSKIYLVELPSDNPSSQQITLAYTSQWPDAPNPPLEGTVVVDPARNNLSYRWNTQSNTWYKISEVAINQFTNTTLGTIKGSTSDGEVQANSDGTGSVTGWDTVKANITTLQENALSNLRPVATADALNLELINQNSVIKNNVAIPIAGNAQAGIINANTFDTIQTTADALNTMKPERYSYFFQWDTVNFSKASETVDIGTINISDENNNPLVELRVYLTHYYSGGGTQADNYAGIAYQSGNYIISQKNNDLYYSRGNWGGGNVPVGTRVTRSNTENNSVANDEGLKWWRTGTFKISSGSETEMPVLLETMTIAIYNENLTDITSSGSEKVKLRLDLTTPNVAFNWLIQPSTTSETQSRNGGGPSA